jgi:hypothetical protein
MQEIKSTNMINQIRVNRLDTQMGDGNMDQGGYAVAQGVLGKTERDVQRDELKRQQGDLEKAGGVMADRDAALKAGDNDLAQTKKAELEALGVDGNASAGDLRTQLGQNNQAQQNMLAEDVVNRSAAQKETAIAIARTKEDYGVTREDREAGRKERKD